MSDNQNQNSDLDLSLHFLPDWAKQGSNKNIYENFSGRDESDGGRQRVPRKGGSDRRPKRSSSQKVRKSSDTGERGQGQRQDRGNRGGRRPDRRPGGGQRGPRREAEPLIDIDVAFFADEAISKSLTEQIKLTARAYPLFSIAHMILEKPERYSVKLTTVKKKGSDEVEQKLYTCALDGTVWLSESDASDYLLKKHLGTFYETVKTEAEPPKGTYTFVGQCGISGVILGPPNYHDYQNQLRKLYNDRFSRKMSFDRFKSRVKIVRDEETVKKWLDEQSFVTTYKVLNSPESLELNSWSEVLEHFNENHKDNLIHETSSHLVKGKEAAECSCPSLRRLIRVRLQDQKRFPLKVVHLLSQQLSSKGLQFFKVNKSVTHVCVSRPHYLDLDKTSVKSGIRKIIQFINEHQGCNRKQLIDNLSESYAVDAEKGTTSDIKAASDAVAPAEPESASEPGEDATNPDAETSNDQDQLKAKSEPTPIQKTIIGDLHWLLYQGNVIEFASGILEVAKKPEVKPSRTKDQKGDQKEKKQKEKAQPQASSAENVDSQGGETDNGGEKKAPDSAPQGGKALDADKSSQDTDQRGSESTSSQEQVTQSSKSESPTEGQESSTASEAASDTPTHHDSDEPEKEEASKTIDENNLSSDNNNQ